MLNNKIITAGVVVVIVLAIIYIGNKAMTSTPQSGALGQTQYKIVPVWDQTQGNNLTSSQQRENQLNKFAGDGWELVETTDNGNSYILKKN